MQPALRGASCHWCLQGTFFIAKPSEYIQMIASPFHCLLCSLFLVLHAKHCKKTHPEHLSAPQAFLPVSNPPVQGVWVAGREGPQNILKSSSWNDSCFCGGGFFWPGFWSSLNTKQTCQDLLPDWTDSAKWLFSELFVNFYIVLFCVLKVFSPTVCAA